MTGKKKVGLFIVVVLLSLICILSVKVKKELYFLKTNGKIVLHNDKDTMSISLDKIKSVQVMNLDRATERREDYEGNLRKNFGEKFLGFNIGDEIRLSGVDGKKVIVFENIITHEKIMYKDIIKTEEDKSRATKLIIDRLKDGVYKVYSINNPDIFALWSYDISTEKCAWQYVPKCDIFNFSHMEFLFNKFGVKLSIITAINNVAKQPDGTYGLIFEDDFLVDKDFYQKLEKVLSSVPKDFDALKLSIASRDLLAGYNKLRYNNSVVGTMLRLYSYVNSVDWIMFYNMLHIKSSFHYGNQGFLVSAEGARKIVNYYKTHLATEKGTDIEMWQIISHIDRNIKNYIYCKEVPVRLSSQSLISYNAFYTHDLTLEVR